MVKLKVAGGEWWFDEVPNLCSLCHHAIDPRYLIGVVREDQPMGRATIELVFQCPRKDCLRVFIGRYDGDYSRDLGHHSLFLRATTPFIPPPPNHPEDVAALSPSFVAIYSEAAAAEAWQLQQVAGCGYRKALEFLIKDYCVAESPNDAEAIRSQLLGTVIKERIDDVNIKEVARRAAWLGNDETHYVRIWADKDMTDLKALITLVVSWMNTHLLTKKVLKEMPESR